MTESTGQATEFLGKRALIVDDSKSARAFLARMLEKHGIEVDTAETAEQAIVYLARTRPDVIFMDHLMPGMDGFQAVQSIKNNPRTATIPIMMFTSQEGELYLGQARALGALGVLPKQVKPTEVSTVLHQLRLVPDRRRARVTSFEPGNAVAHEAFQRSAAPVALAAVTTGTDGPLSAPASPAEAGLAPAQLRGLVDDVVREQLGELRRSFSTLLEDHAERIIAQLREPTPTPTPGDASGEGLFAAHEPAPAPPRAPWLIAALASLVAAAFAVMWWQETRSAHSLAAQLVESQGELQARTAAAAQAVAAAQLVPSGARTPLPEMPSPWTPAASPASLSTSSSSSMAATSAPSAAAASGTAVPMGVASETLQRVPYGEVPMSGERFESLRRLLDDLAARRFRGVVTVTSFPGRYCLTGNPTEGFAPAALDAPMSKCEVLGNPFDDQLGPAQREPLALANLVGAIRQRSGGTLDIQLVTGAETQRVVGYPDASDRMTAGDWNRAAVSNNRVEIRVQPAGP